MESVGTRLFTATSHFLRAKPMLTEEEVRSMLTLKEYLDRVYRYHRRRSSLSGSGRQYFNASNFRPIKLKQSGAFPVMTEPTNHVVMLLGSTGSRRSVGLVASRAEHESGLATAAIKGILCAVHPFTELSEYEVNTSVFEKLFGTTIAYYWSLYKPFATKIAWITTLWCLLYNSPLQSLFLTLTSETVCRLISMFAILWLVLYFWSQLNWRMTVTVLGYFDAWFFITQAILYAVAIMALYDWDVVVIVYNVFGILGFSAVIAYDAYPLSMRNMVKYMLFVIMACLFAGVIMMGLDSGFMDRSLRMDLFHGLVHANCQAEGNVTLTWSFNVYDFAIQRLQILTVYMIRNTYWAFNAPRYCVIIKSRVALEEMPVIGVRILPSEPTPGRRNSLIGQSFKATNLSPVTAPTPPPLTSSSSTVTPVAAGIPAAASASMTSSPLASSSGRQSAAHLQPNTGPLYDMHPIQNDTIHTYDGRHRMSVVSVPNLELLNSGGSGRAQSHDDDASTSVEPTAAIQASAFTVVVSAPMAVHRPPKPTRSLKLPKLSTRKLLMESVSRSRNMTKAVLRTSTVQSSLRGYIQRIPVKKRKSSSVPSNLHALARVP
ncbi:hypothetical protein DYB38_006813 [Aphanomyces astaci]|uniref:Uncharacterized protein n=3 Tax=Aphanomyces astaci TaxID=112090 RepID=A0A397A9U4_APHAT|nr:hypothetical protein DYB36_003394 [Aphanomyces astaci]RHY57806.1 hypothetical protein DYB38_006813 [Aphanomyces astaci]